MEPGTVVIPCCTFTEYMSLIGAIATVILLPTFAFIREMRTGRVESKAAAVAQLDAQNRYNATRGAEPVTMQSPPESTGNSTVDKAVADLLTNAAPAPTAVTTIALEERMKRIEELLLAHTAAPGADPARDVRGS